MIRSSAIRSATAVSARHLSRGRVIEPSGANAPGRGIPTARSLDHVGLVVPQLDEAVAFFVRVIGCDLLYRTRTVFDPSGGDWMTRHFNAPADARLRTAMLRCGPTANLELLEWKIPGVVLRAPTSGLGAAHLAIFVEDLERAVAHLSAEPGLRVLGTPTLATDDLHEGTEFVFVLLPWGLTLELVRWPPLMPYRATTSATLALPSPTWRSRP